MTNLRFDSGTWLGAFSYSTLSKSVSYVCCFYEACYNPTALLLPTVLVNIIVIVVYFYPRLRIRYPEFNFSSHNHG